MATHTQLGTFDAGVSVSLHVELSVCAHRTQNAQVGGGVSMDGLRNNVQVSLFTGVLLSVEFIRSFTFTSLISLVRPPKLKYM